MAERVNSMLCVYSYHGKKVFPQRIFSGRSKGLNLLNACLNVRHCFWANRKYVVLLKNKDSHLQPLHFPHSGHSGNKYLLNELDCFFFLK